MQGAKKNFRIDQISKKLGLKKSTLRDWEETFKLSPAKNKNRLYTSDDLATFAKIKDLSSKKEITKEEIAATVRSWNTNKTETATLSINPKQATEGPLQLPAIIVPVKLPTPAEKVTATPATCQHKHFFSDIKIELMAIQTRLSKPHRARTSNSDEAKPVV